MRLRRISFISLTWAVAVTTLSRAQGQGPAALNKSVPLVTAAATETSPGAVAVTMTAALRAQEMGFPATAAGLYRGALTQAGADRAAITLGLATALLDEGNAVEAEAVLNAFVGLRGSAWQLRAGLVSVQLRKIDGAKAAVAGVKEGELPTGDRAWWFYLQGLLAGDAGDVKAANKFFEQAQGAAPTELVRTRFRLEEERALLRRSGTGNEAQLAEQRQSMEKYAGQAIGYLAARGYAANLNALGRRAQAIMAIQQQLLGLPRDERQYGDDFRLWLGLIAGAADGAGRTALTDLVGMGRDAVRQRMALRLLAQASEKDPARGQFRAELGRLIGLTPAHPLLEDFYLYRANLRLGDKSYAAAEDDARTLLEKFPGSPLKAEALEVLTGAAWEQRRFRLAADSATKAVAALSTGSRKAELGVLVAEAWFRAQDYRQAADAYAAVLRDPPTGLPAATLSALRFQRVQAEIEAGAPEAAQTVLDALARDAGFLPEDRWQAEWNVARALQAHGAAGVAAAYARVELVLGGKADAGLPVDLRARLEWLRARLALEVDPPQPARTLGYIDALAKTLAGVSPGLRAEIASSGALLKAQALFKQGSEEAGVAQLQKLRDEFKGSDAAVSSYLEEADHYAKLFNTVRAQQLYTDLADKFPANINAPYALYFAALQAEARGDGDATLREANNLLDKLVVKYPQSDLVFAALLKQGHLLRRLNQFPQAQQAYESLVNTYATSPDVVLAQLALAECHNAQAASDPAHLENALVLLEHLRDRVDAPVDVRTEAGFNLGMVLKQRGELEKAATVWWRDVVSAFLTDAKASAQLGAKGRYWMARTLIEFGALREQQGQLEEAKEAWLLILKTGLPGEGQAKARLAPFGITGPRL
ncbi:MAG: tetratricopeptide repeat protein [Undibacterium sp.]|nr:tetratricopeptide repeat protein [Opitutaceae bacterium]